MSALDKFVVVVVVVVVEDVFDAAVVVADLGLSFAVVVVVVLGAIAAPLFAKRFRGLIFLVQFVLASAAAVVEALVFIGR
jgi:hypothetical protein